MLDRVRAFFGRLWGRNQPESLREQLLAAHLMKRAVRVIVTECAYTCCARTFARCGYEQPYEGDVLAVGEAAFCLGAPGIGTWSYKITAPFGSLLEVEVL